MKRKTKVRLISSIGFLLVSSTLLLPFTFAINNFKKTHINTLSKTNNNIKSFIQSDVEISSNNFITLAKPMKDVSNPNVYKSIYGGFVYLSTENNVVCVDKNNPTKILWEDSFGEGYNILSIEYEAKNDSILILYSVLENDMWTIKVRKINNASNSVIEKSNSLSPTNTEMCVITKYKYNENTCSPLTWGFVPIYQYYSTATEMLIYPKLLENASDSVSKTWYVYNSENNTFKTLNVNYRYPNDKQAILSMMVIHDDKFSNGYMAAPLIARSSNNSNYLEYDLYNWLYDSSSVNATSNHQTKTIDWATDGNDIFEITLAKRIEYVANTTNVMGMSIPTFTSWATNDLIVYAIINFGRYKYRPIYCRITIDYYNKKLKDLKTSEVFTHDNDEVNKKMYFGYFYNAPIQRNGFGNFKGKQTPFIASGTSDKTYNKHFVTIFNNPDGAVAIGNKETVDNNVFGENLDDDRARLYLFKENSNTQGNPNYTTSSNNAYQIPFVFYDDSTSSLDNVFSKNIFTVNGGGDDVIYIDQEARGQATSNPASYAYYSKILKIEFDDEQQTNIDGLTIDTINSLFNFDEIYSSSKLPATWKNMRSDSILTVDPNSLFINTNSKTIYFDLYATILYNENGKLLITTLQELKNDFSKYQQHKLATITIKNMKFNDGDVDNGDNSGGNDDEDNKPTPQPPSIVVEGSTTFVGGTVQGFSNIFPSDYYEGVQNINGIAFKKAIIPLIQQPKDKDGNIINELIISTSDIKEIKLVSFDNSKGQVVINVTIQNSKVVINDELQETWTFVNITIDGFNQNVINTEDSAKNDNSISTTIGGSLAVAGGGIGISSVGYILRKFLFKG